ncbi:hypothetical protein BIFGAL_02961 [Bifidobacterium gallicum DSM 20093 = LMG 11596]|uniref:Uncharacterized protein n=1 Tax=Bifidobacterium gallicum DSM 20093 = LMG 11596 TaxID=561180 RepID=D1NT50_9BIFI|nr:hypothetical protein BIFGAL_02961 [Bifidobacterium gallicum DSM 20093 = LMG 11596]
MCVPFPSCMARTVGAGSLALPAPSVYMTSNNNAGKLAGI